MSLTNVNRDSFHLTLNQSEIAWSGNGSGFFNSSGNVNDSKAYASSFSVSNIANTSAFGVFMKAPLEERQPFRVKAKIRSDDINNTFLIIGYAPASITGTDDVLTKIKYFPSSSGEIDEIFMIEPVDSLDPNYLRPIGFGIVSLQNVTNYAHISVQNMGISPPAFSMGVS